MKLQEPFPGHWLFHFRWHVGPARVILEPTAPVDYRNYAVNVRWHIKHLQTIRRKQDADFLQNRRRP
jgi:hypothetical protein